jgi:hypothetical protein
VKDSAATRWQERLARAAQIRARFLEETGRSATSRADELLIFDWAGAAEIPLTVIFAGLVRAVNKSVSSGAPIAAFSDVQPFISAAVAEWKARQEEARRIREEGFA